MKDKAKKQLTEEKELQRRAAMNGIELYRKYSFLIDEARPVNISIDMNRKIIDANELALKSLGFEKKDLLGKDITELIAPSQREKAIEGYALDLQGIDNPTVEVDLIGQKGIRTFLFAQDAVALFEKNQQVGISLNAFDITERKRLEESLRKSEEKYRKQFDEVMDAIFVADVETGILIDCNRAACELVGWEKAELVGKPQRDLHPPEKTEGEFSRTFKQHLKEKEGQILETQVITKKGEIKDVAIKANLFELTGRKVLQGSFRDITKQKKTERELQQSIQAHQLLMNTSLAGIWYEVYEKPIDITLPEMEIARLMYETGIITEANDVMAKMYGLDNASQLKGKHWPEIIPAQEELDVYLQYIRAGYNAYGLITHETDMEGNSIYIENSLAANIENNKLISYFGTARDITEHIQAQEQLRESEEKYRVLTQSALDGIIVAAEDGKILLWNPGAQRIFGYTAKEAVGQEITHLIIPQKYRRKIAQRWGNFFERGTTSLINYTQEFAGLRKNGIEFPAEISFGFMEIQGKKQSVAITRDITERKKAQQQLESAFIDLASTVSRAMETRDPYTSNHQRRVAELARLIGKKMNLDKQRLKGLYIAGLLHDIGKISTPEVILSKPGELSPEEWQLIRAHTKEGYDILKDTDLPWPVADMALHHHERLDGSGYPHGLSGDKLTLENRILGLCDVVEAMSSHRPYRPARKKQEVIEEIKNGRGTKYDASVVDIMLGIIESGEFNFSNEPKTSAATKAPLTLKR